MMPNSRSRPKRKPQALLDASHLARLAWEHLERWRLHDRMQRTLGTLQRAGIWVVVGEARLLENLQGRLHEAGDLLRELGKDLDEAKLDRLKELLVDAAWDVAERLAADLDDKLARQQEMIHGYTERVADWQARVVDLRNRRRPWYYASFARRRRRLAGERTVLPQAEGAVQ